MSFRNPPHPVFTKREIDRLVINAPYDEWGATNIHYDPSAPAVETFEEWTQRKLAELSERVGRLICDLDAVIFD